MSVALTIVLVAILVLVLTGTFDSSPAPPKSRHVVCHGHGPRHHCRDRVSR